MIQIFHNPNFLLDGMAGRIPAINDCIYVADIDTDNLEHAWDVAQNKDECWLQHPKVTSRTDDMKMRSTSCGDILVKNNVKYFVAAAGLIEIKEVIINYFKKPQFVVKKDKDGPYHYYKVYGGPGKTKSGYQEVINFLNDFPMMYVDINFETDPFGVTGTWTTFEEGIEISKEEYERVYQLATNNPGFQVR